MFTHQTVSFLYKAAVAAMLSVSLIATNAGAQPGTEPGQAVTVIIDMTPASAKDVAATQAALNDYRSLLKRHAGFLSEESLQSQTAANAPRFVHISHWATLANWSALAKRPEFAAFIAPADKRYTASTGIFKATAPQSRGELLYSTHCVTCHRSLMHWRDRQTAIDWHSIKYQVRRWQAAASLSWSDSDILEVTRYLNEKIYRFDVKE